MAHTIETFQTHSQDECSIVATFSNESLKQLLLIQAQLSDILGETVWLTPQKALHSTLMEIICDRDYENLSRNQHFIQWYKQYSDVVAKTLAELPPFEITFCELEVSQRVIIVKSKSSEVLNTIRSKLLSNTMLPEGTKLPPNITHCSLARYN